MTTNPNHKRVWKLGPCGGTFATRAEFADGHECTTAHPRWQPTTTTRRLAVDAAGFVWWHNPDDTWSMARTNPDNTPIPHPITYYRATAPQPSDHARWQKQIAEALRGWPVGEPCQFVSEEEADELANFLLPVLDRLTNEYVAQAFD